MKKLVIVTLIISLILCFVCIGVFIYTQSMQDDSRAYALAANEVDKLINTGDLDLASEKATKLRDDISEGNRPQADYTPFIMLGICLLFIFGVSGYVAVKIVRPFDKLKGFADRVSVGDLDVPLKYEKTDYFGNFTFAFDNMRDEIKRARTSEQTAIENNKTVIASLSHDIKTPISSIRAYAEALDMGMDMEEETRDQYVKTIIDKCDEVSKLSEDMLMHSLSDMEKLKLYPTTFELGRFLEEELEGQMIAGSKIDYKRPSYDIMVNADMARMSQVVDNIIGNSRKYAGTDNAVYLFAKDGRAVIIFRDFGDGIPDKDIPFVFDRFYRGSNIGKQTGAGLGLYIVKYIIENSGGSVRVRNDGGLITEIELPIIS